MGASATMINQGQYQYVCFVFSDFTRPDVTMSVLYTNGKDARGRPTSMQTALITWRAAQLLIPTSKWTRTPA